MMRCFIFLKAEKKLRSVVFGKTSLMTQPPPSTVLWGSVGVWRAHVSPSASGHQNLQGKRFPAQDVYLLLHIFAVSGRQA